MKILSKYTQRKIGLEQELGTEGCAGGELPRVKETIEKNPDMKIMDAKVDCGCIELISSPLSLTKFKNPEFLKARAKLYKDSKLNVHKNGGTHLHISIKENDSPNLAKNMIYVTGQFYGWIQKICKRESQRWAPNQATGWEFAYKPFCHVIMPNIVSYRDYGMITRSRISTMEFRGPKGTKSINDIMAWAEFLENLTEQCKDDNLEKISFADLVKGRHIEALVNKLIKQGELPEDCREYKINPNYRVKEFGKKEIVKCA